MYDGYIYRLSTSAPQTVFSIDLPKDLLWVDEFTWNKVEQSVDYSLTGALLIEEGVKQEGRYITLNGVENMAWITRGQGETLRLMSEIPGLQITMKFLEKNTPANVLYTKLVMFRHFEKPAVDLKSIRQFNQYDTNAYYIINSLKFMEI